MHQSFDDDSDDEYLDELRALEREAATRAIVIDQDRHFKLMTQTLDALAKRNAELDAEAERLHARLIRRLRDLKDDR